MNAMILAAGRGERLRPYTDTCPKPLLPVNGKPLIEYHLEALASAGIQQVVINVNWLAEMIQHRLGNGSQYGLSICYSHENQTLETAGGIVQALPLLHDQFIVVNGDILTDYPFHRLFNRDSSAHLVLVDNPAHNPQGDFRLDHGLIKNGGKGQHNTFSGIAVYQKSFFAQLSPGRRALGPVLRMSADTETISGELYAGNWIDVGTVERWHQVSS